MDISSYSSSTGPFFVRLSGRGGAGKQFPIFFSFFFGTPSTGELPPEDEATLDAVLGFVVYTSFLKKNELEVEASLRCARCIFSSTYPQREQQTLFVGIFLKKTHFGYWDIEIKVELKDCPRKKYDKDSEGCVLEISHLHLHTPEFDPPANRRIWWWGFETQCLPVR